MQISTAHCTQVADIGEGRTHAWIQSTIIPQPGQFMLARYWPGIDPYLSKVVFPAALTSDGFVLELPAEDPTLPYLTPGKECQLTGPLGQPVPIRPQPNVHLLLICSRSPHTMLPLAQKALDSGADVTLLLEHPYPLNSLDTRIEIRRGELLTLLTDHIDWAEQVCLDCMPGADLYATLQPILRNGYALFTETLPCGIGACQSCAVQIGKTCVLACINGPFLPLSKVYEQ